MDNLEKKLTKELARFNQIGYNSQNLKEQMLGNVDNGSGFMEKDMSQLRMGSTVRHLGVTYIIYLTYLLVNY